MNVYYHLIKDGKVLEKRNYICFASMINNWEGPDLVRYVAPINNQLSSKEVLFFLSFLENVFDGNLFTYKPIKRHGANCIFYELNVKGMNKQKVLTYLTAFRYIDEFSHLVKQLYQETQKAKQIRVKFNKFMEIHKKNNIGCGHSLTCAYNPNVNLTQYEEFRERILGNSKIDSVHHYFSSTKLPKPIRVYHFKEKNLSYFWEDIKVL